MKIVKPTVPEYTSIASMPYPKGSFGKNGMVVEDRDGKLYMLVIGGIAERSRTVGFWVAVDLQEMKVVELDYDREEFLPYSATLTLERA